MKKWAPYNNGKSIGGLGSENGVILYDEEFDSGCRITLEKCDRYHAITCGVYGAMVHTVFCSSSDAEKTYEEMKSELSRFMCTQTTMEEETEFYNYFFNKYQ